MREWEIILAQPVMQALAWALLHSLWQGAAVAALLAVVLSLLSEKAAHIRYAVSCIALLLLLLLPLATWLLKSSSTGDAQTASLSSTLPTESASHQTAATSNAASLQSETAATSEPPQSWQKRLTSSLEKFLPWSTLVWLAGVILLSLRLLGGTLYVHHIKTHQTYPLEKSWQEKFELLAGKFRMTKPVRLLASRLISVPVAIGWLRPAILLPTSVITGLTPQQLEAILAHELAHIRRHDYLINLFQAIVETLLFYHPAVWWVSRRIRIEREYCCDDLAVEMCGDPLVYARALTQVERFRQLTPQLAVAANGGLLMHRIHRLVGIQSKRTERLSGTLAGVFVISMLIAFGLVTRGSLISNTTAKANDMTAAERVEAAKAADTQQASAPASAQQSRMPIASQGHLTLPLNQQEQLPAEVAEKVKALDSSDPSERASAACALGKMQAAEAVPFLVKKLGDDAPIGAIQCWERGKWNPAVESFKNPSTGEQAAIALAAIGRPSLYALMAALTDANPGVRRNAAWAIGELRGGHGIDRQSAVEPLIAMLKDSDSWARKAAAFSLGEIRDERAGESLILALDDNEPQVRETAAWALGEMKDERAVRRLSVALTNDEHWSVRSRAAWALGEIKASNAVEALTNALNDHDQRVRSKAQWALSEIQDN